MAALCGQFSLSARVSRTNWPTLSGCVPSMQKLWHLSDKPTYYIYIICLIIEVSLSPRPPCAHLCVIHLYASLYIPYTCSFSIIFCIFVIPFNLHHRHHIIIIINCDTQNTIIINNNNKTKWSPSTSKIVNIIRNSRHAHDTHTITHTHTHVHAQQTLHNRLIDMLFL